MRGLLWKDLKNLKHQVVIYAFMATIWFIVSLVNWDASFLGGVLMMLSVIMPITAMGYDERAKWDRYALTMPVSRADLVVSKYLLGGLFTLFGAIFTTVISLLLTGDAVKSLLTVLFLFSLGLFFLSVILPFMFKFGVEKGRFMLMAIALLPTALILFLSENAIPSPSDTTLMGLSFLAPVLAVAALAVSLAVSLAIYRRKEF
ncbi:MAG: ABC-2 transporter permease [Intestinimonas sp.]|jgi:ABC-type transport system involved in multi-copper enzyme maturation permease subunit|nr:ABC-2 transporter permease [Intestinimonas sp.]